MASSFFIPLRLKNSSIIFQDFNSYNFVEELDSMLKSFEASYGRQMYSGAVEKLQLAISWEVNHAMTKGNEELAERLKESDTTLLVSHGRRIGNGKETCQKIKDEPTREEIETALQQIAAEDLEIRTAIADSRAASGRGRQRRHRLRQRVQAGTQA